MTVTLRKPDFPSKLLFNINYSIVIYFSAPLKVH